MRLPLEKLPPWRWLVALLPVTAVAFYAPLAFGGTTFRTRIVIDSLLVLSFLLWAGVLFLERRVPRIPRVLAAALAVLLFLGVLQFFNPQSVIDSFTFDAEPCPNHVWWLPGTIDAETSGWVLLHLLSLALAGLFLRDGLSRFSIRRFLFRVVALSGFVIALVGIYQKTVGTDTMLWGVKLPNEGNFFAAFRYHGNAASFLNLSWPVALAIWIRSRLRKPGSLVASLDLAVFLVTFGALFVNSSKAGLLLAPAGLVLAVWLFRRGLSVATTSRAGVLVMTGFLILLGAIAVLPGFIFKLSKWKALITEGQTLQGRLDAQRACLLAIHDKGLYGTGAGTFHYAFPPYKDQIEGLVGYWEHAHQDWLQTIIEWGWLGFAAWAVIFAGAMIRLWSRISRSRRRGRPELTAGASFLALVLVLVHSLADFPMQIPALQALVVFHLAMAWSSRKRRRRKKRRNVRSVRNGRSEISVRSTPDGTPA